MLLKSQDATNQKHNLTCKKTIYTNVNIMQKINTSLQLQAIEANPTIQVQVYLFFITIKLHK